jgi:transcription elongation factor Elf1
MSNKAIPGVCPRCGEETLVIAGQIRDYKDWQIKYGIECECCGYKFTIDKKSADKMLTLLRNKEKGTK